MPAFSTCLWFDQNAESAARFYVDLFNDAKIETIQRLQTDTPSGKAGDVVAVTFSLNGTPFTLLNGGTHHALTPAASIIAHCGSQIEVDRVWDALLEGGSPMQCGWLTDRFGVSWQIIPDGLTELLNDPDQGRAARAAQAMLAMVKLDIDTIRAAADRA